MKNHLKRIAAPKSWLIARKEGKFVVRPNPGAHSFERGMALGVVLRDNLKLAGSMSEVRKLLNSQAVMVDGKVRKSHKFIVGLFDTIAIPVMKKFFRVTFDNKGRLLVMETSEEDSRLKPIKIVGKTVIKKGKTQYNLIDGKNVLADVKAKVGDTLVLELPSLKIKSVVEMKEGVAVFLMAGKKSGDHGVLSKINGKDVVYKSAEGDVETKLSHLYAIGNQKSVVEVKQK